LCNRDSYDESMVSGQKETAVTTKETIKTLLDRLPDDCSLEDVLYHLYVIQAVEQGRADAAAGRAVSHQDVAEALRRKWLVGGEK
jgi:hypothetical protein